ncbi:MAG: sulfite exporter TauE/SafE family protein [Planctomycetia bacterium]|nr:sulfite exporter TauE/SafE family protein [Planctomycetia bacterium]
MPPDLSELGEFFILVPLGFIVGLYGTLVGAGGGSVLVPALLFLYPRYTPASITASSLAVVFFNAYSGTIAYVRMGRVDYRAALVFSVAGLPGAVLGVLLVHDLRRELFDPLFGVLLLLIGAVLVVSPLGTRGAKDAVAPGGSRSVSLLGSIGSAYIALVSGMLGIGGGVIHVPFLIRVVKQPPHVATATSHFVLTFLALAAVVTHLALREYRTGLSHTMYLAVGVMMGAPLGAALSAKMKGSVLVRLLAVALCLVGLRLLARSFL